jgi:hypothetical protein
MGAERRKSIDLCRDSVALTGQIVLMTADPGLKPTSAKIRIAFSGAILVRE